MKNLVMALTILMSSSAFAITTRINCSGVRNSAVKIEMDIADMSKLDLNGVMTAKHRVVIINEDRAEYSFQLNPFAIHPFTNEPGVELNDGAEASDYDRVFLVRQNEGQFRGDLIVAGGSGTIKKRIAIKCTQVK
ncbi:MAG: hypothetical protein V4736_07670 [Bdellovibrionota bacterium]